MGLLKEVIKKFILSILFILLVLVILFPTIGFFEPIIQKYLFDIALQEKNLHKFFVFFFIFVILGFFTLIVEYFYTLFRTKFENKIRFYILEKLLPYYYRLPYLEVSKRDTGYYLSRIYEEPQEIIISILSLIFTISSSIMSLISRLIAMIILSPISTIVIIPMLIISFVITLSFQNKVATLSVKRLETEAQLRGVLADALKSFEFINIFNLIKFITYHISLYASEFLNTLYKFTKISQNYELLSRIANVIVQITFIGINIYLLFIGKITAGDFFGFFSAYYPFYSSLGVIFNSVPEAISRFSQLRRIDEILEISKTDGVKRGNLIILKNIYFSYDSQEIIKGINLEIHKGEKILIVGPNGSGKSTLLKIIAGLLEPKHGEVITFNDISLLPKYIPDIPIFEYLNIIEIFNKEVLLELLKYFELPADKKPSQLSAGQYRKFSIALTLSKPADCYIFDEPFENIDKESVPKVANKILSLLREKTIIVVTHSYESLFKDFDKIFEIKEGKLFFVQ